MNNVMVYCEIEEDNLAAISLGLLSKGRKLANELKCSLEAVVVGHKLKEEVKDLNIFGVDKLYIADDKSFSPYRTAPHTALLCSLIEETKPQILLIGASSIGRDLAPRVSARLRVGLTADCTDLQIGTYEDRRNKKVYNDLLYQIRPAFGGNIIATIINPKTRPQMATVREGVMKKEELSANYKMEIVNLDCQKTLEGCNNGVEVIKREIEKRRVDLVGAQIIVSGGFGVGSKENFELLFKLASLIGGEVGASRAAVDAGFIGSEHLVGQTGFTVRPKLYIAVGISGAIQHSAGMQGASQIISINSDPGAPINQLADYSIIGDLQVVIPKIIKYFKEESK